MNEWIFWAPVACAALHMLEEFAWPGGFAAWFRIYRPETAVSFTRTFAVLVNTTLMVVTLFVGWVGPRWDGGISAFLTLVSVLAFNGLFHVVGALRTHRYSPGMVTGMLLYIPLCAYSSWYFIRVVKVSPQLVIVSLAIGSIYQIWSFMTHRARAVRASALR
ncbi:MAG: HXXEE domain-containing protein [Bacillota bacterium]